jgi:hypothetical protein
MLKKVINVKQFGDAKIQIKIFEFLKKNQELQVARRV